MRFISVINITEEEHKYLNVPLTRYKQKQHSQEMGILLWKCFGYLKDEQHSSPMSTLYNMEIQAFPQEQWMLFKTRLKDFLGKDYSTLNETFRLIMVGKLIKELEEFGHYPEEKEDKDE